MSFQAMQDPKPGSWQQVKDVISISRVQSLPLNSILGLSTLRKPFPISTFRKLNQRPMHRRTDVEF